MPRDALEYLERQTWNGEPISFELYEFAGRLWAKLSVGAGRLPERWWDGRFWRYSTRRRR